MSDEITNSEDDQKLQQVANYYRRKILTGQIGVGERLPSPEEMEERHGIPRADAYKVYAALKARDLASRQRPEID
jgi:DNA-binding transcriptional regulator YhcF (GntR family)